MWTLQFQIKKEKLLEILAERFGRLNDIENYVGTYVSRQWVRKNILFQTDDEIKELDKEIDEEKEDQENIENNQQPPNEDQMQNNEQQLQQQYQQNDNQQ
jgi:hypothetical protein